jgi:hypothetical protein
MQRSRHPDIAELQDAFAAAEDDARRLVEGLDERTGTWRTDDASWSVAQCLDHLAIGNRVYLQAMEGASTRALARGRQRRGPARAGLVGGLFALSLEPPAKPGKKRRAPAKARPGPDPGLAAAAGAFFTTQQDIQAYLVRYEDLDLAGVRFPNPFVRAIHFSLASGLHVLASHERRHLWQAWNVRRAAERQTR